MCQVVCSNMRSRFMFCTKPSRIPFCFPGNPPLGCLLSWCVGPKGTCGVRAGGGGSQPASPWLRASSVLKEWGPPHSSPHLCFGGQMEFRAQTCDHIQHTGPQQHCSISEDVQFAFLLTVFLFLNGDPPVMLPSLPLNLWRLRRPSGRGPWGVPTALLLTAWSSTKGRQEGPSVALLVRRPLLTAHKLGGCCCANALRLHVGLTLSRPCVCVGPASDGEAPARESHWTADRRGCTHPPVMLAAEALPW